MAKDKSKKTVTSKDLEAQRKYAQDLEQSGFDFAVVVGDAFVRGMRDIGYKHTGTAIDELIDNAIQAEAENIHIVLGYAPDNTSKKKPDMIAVVDDGHGMDPVMMRAAALWGGTHREDDRTGFGRYGYGLPSACVSQGRRFTAYSKPYDGQWHSVVVDVDDISEGLYTNKDGRICVPEADSAEVPDWVTEYIQENLPGGKLSSGTVVVIDKLDRLSWKTTEALHRHLLEHFGVTYRNYLRQVEIFVSGTRVDPVDPLFTTPGARFYDLDEDRAEALEPMYINVKAHGGRDVVGTVTVRFSFIPPTFSRKDKNNERSKNPRFHIMKEYNKGIIVCREGRQIDVIDSKCPWTTFVNYDRYWGCEIDFPPTLDEEFSITTSKQQVVLTERMWDLLEHAGVEKAINGLRKRFQQERSQEKVAREAAEDRERASEKAMEEAAKFKTRKPGDQRPEQRQKADENLEREAKKRAKASGIPFEQVEAELVQETQGRPYRVEEIDARGGPFFRMEQRGGQKVLLINTAHRFYTEVYAGPNSTPRVRAALEVLLFVIGDCELDATDDRQLFYETERAEWSRMLNVALNRLSMADSIEDEADAAEALQEQEQTKEG